MSASFENPTADLLMYRSATKLIFLSPAEIIANGKFKNLTDYLESISKPGKLPNRKALQPSQIKHLLADLYIFDIQQQKGTVTDITLRLMGTNVARFYGEHSGKSIQSMENADAVRRIQTCVAKVLSERKNIAVTVAALSANQQHLKVSVLYCPLAEEDQIINQIIGLVDVTSGLT
jgi:hypothetical protein